MVPLFAVYYDGDWHDSSVELHLAWRKPGGAPGEVLEHNRHAWLETIWQPEAGAIDEAAIASTCAANLARFLAEPPPPA